MGVAVPLQEMSGGERVLAELFGAAYVTFKEIYSEAIDLDRVRGWLTDLPAEAVLIASSLLSKYAAVHSLRGPTQPAMVNWMLSPLLRPPVMDLLTPQVGRLERFAFHHESLLLGSKLAILHGDDGPADLEDPEQRYAVGRVLLAVNDLLQDTTSGAAPESDEMLGITVRSLAINAVEEPRYQVARMYNMLVERASGGGPIDILALCRETFDVDLQQLMAFAFFCALPFNPIEPPLPPVLAPADLLNAGTWLAGQVQSHPEWELVMAQLSGDRDWFRGQVADGKVATSTFYPFQLRPYFRLQSGAIIPVSHRFLLDRVGTGMFWMLHDAARVRGGHNVENFMTTVGEVCVEPYAVELLRQSIPAASGQRIIAGRDVPPYRSGGKADVRGSDAYIVDGPRLIVIEITGSGLPVAVLLGGDGAAFRDQFERKLVVDERPNGTRKLGKLGQLDRVVRDLLSADLTLPGVDMSAITTIYPVLISLQHIPQLANVAREIRGLLEEHELFTHSVASVTVAPVRIMTLEELEIIAGGLASGQARLGDVLQRWIDDGLGHDSVLKNHLIRMKYVELDSSHMHAMYDRWAVAEREALISTGLALEAAKE